MSQPSARRWLVAAVSVALVSACQGDESSSAPASSQPAESSAPVSSEVVESTADHRCVDEAAGHVEDAPVRSGQRIVVSFSPEWADVMRPIYMTLHLCDDQGVGDPIFALGVADGPDGNLNQGSNNDLRNEPVVDWADVADSGPTSEVLVPEDLVAGHYALCTDRVCVPLEVLDSP